MLAVSNRTTWENYFKSLVITSSVLTIFASSNTLTNAELVGRNNEIIEYSSKMVNSFVPTTAPTELIQLTINNFSSLPSTTQNLLKNKKRLYIYYLINGTSITDPKMASITDFELERNGKIAHIKAHSLYEGLTFENDNEQIIQTTNFPDCVPNRLTFGAYIQYLALYRGRAINNSSSHITQIADFTTNDVGLISFPTTIAGHFSNLNYDEWTFSFDDHEMANITILGYTEVGTYDTFISGSATTGSTPTLTISVPLDATYSRIQADAKKSGGYVGSNYRTIKGNSATFIWTPPFGEVHTTYTYQVKGYEAVLPNVDYNSQKYCIVTYAFMSGSTQLDYVQNLYRNYYSNIQLVEFDCGRIDPTLEPLDLIEMNFSGTNYNVLIEEITIQFNGTYYGHIKGRIITQPTIAVTTQPTKTKYYVNETFDATGLVVTATYSNGSTSNITSLCTISSPSMSSAGNKTVTVTYNYLGTTLTTTFTITVYQKKAPVISNVNYATSNPSFTIKNDNPTSVVAYFSADHYIYQDTTYNLTANQTKTLNGTEISNISSDLRYCFDDKRDGGFYTDGNGLRVRFKFPDGTYSGYATILTDD